MKFKLRRYCLYYFGRVAIFFISLLPYKIGLFLAAKAGALAYWILVKYRNITIENLTFALGKERQSGELRTIGRRVFENLGKNAFEIINFPKINKDNIDDKVEIVNIENFDEAFKKGKGIIIVTAHFGNWELVGATLRLKGYPGAAVGRRIYFDKYDRYLNKLRKIHDVNIIYRDESPRKVLKVLKDNGIIGILADQDVDSVDGVFVDFFGRQAYTPAGPVLLAKASRAVLIPTFMVRQNGRHKFVIEKPVQLTDTGDKEKDLIENTNKWSKVVESYVRRYPEQWVWMHRRWKTGESHKTQVKK